MAPSTLQDHILETDCTILKVKMLIWALWSTSTVSCECVFTEVLLTSLRTLLWCCPDTFTLLPTQPDEILHQDYFRSAFYMCFSLTYQKPRLRRLAPQRWHPRARIPSALSSPCLCLQMWTLQLTPFPLWSSQDTPRLGRWVSQSEPSLPSLPSTSTCHKTTLIKGLPSPPHSRTVSHRRARGWEQERLEAKILCAVSPAYAGKAQGWDFCFIRKPPTENHVWSCFSQPQAVVYVTTRINL